MKNKFVLLTVIMVSSLFYQCQKDWVETPKEEIKEAYFPHEIQDWGESFASNMNCATVEAKQKKMLKSADIFLQENTSVKKIDNFNASLLGFSKKQLQILELIAHAKSKSDSYIAFSNRLVQINDEIYKTIPKAEQEKLLYITSALYYGLKEINNLVRDGIIPGNHEGGDVSLASMVRLKSGGVEDDPDEDSWWDNPSSLAGIWAIAIAEPTPIGEAVALVATGIIGSYYVLTRADCINEYVDCKLYTSNNNCSDCLHYCIVKGDWNCN